MRLANFTSPEVRSLVLDNLVAVAPLGSFEQHGPHLPLTVDTDVVTAIADAIERALPEKILLLPCLWIGHSTHQMYFFNTLDISQMHYNPVIHNLCRSILAIGVIRGLLLSGHSGNDIPVRAALREVKIELQGRQGVHVLFASYRMLRDGSKHTSAYRKANMRHAKPAYSGNEFHEISESGVAGHADPATAKRSRRFFDALVRDVSAFVEDLPTW